jgi:23S rRNA (cytosine1962-C5)-methyltransferase
MASIRLKAGRERPLKRRHPWIFSGAIESVHGDPAAAESVDVFSSQGEWFATAAYSPHSQIRGRVLSWDRDQEIGPEFIRARIDQALRNRVPWQKLGESNAWREVFSESDGMPGLIVDRYDDVRVVQFHTAWADSERDTIVQALSERGDCRLIYERSEAEVRQLEGLESRSGVLWGEYESNPIEIFEGDLRYLVDIQSGHKTGFYLDQKENRAWLRRMVSAGSVLDAFAYTGSFSLVCLKAGAEHVTAIDSSRSALEMAQKNLDLNRLEPDRFDVLEEDVFTALRGFRDRGASFDLIILDPPKFAATAAQVGRASRAYKDINLLAMKLLKPGGTLATFSCSGGVSGELFQKIVADSALDAGVQAAIRHHFHQACDHPVQLAFPESQYLKGFLVQAD